VTAAEAYEPLLADGLVWVAEADGALVGFAACEAFDDALHLWELAVRRECQGRGLGRALVAACIAQARIRGLPGVTLTTFRDIAWNAPFYAGSGFAEVPQGALNARLAGDLDTEARRGLDIANRCAMRLTL
jgi:N-acetylglutamate synthase-like GNAT family acetyltransferase